MANDELKMVRVRAETSSQNSRQDWGQIWSARKEKIRRRTAGTTRIFRLRTDRRWPKNWMRKWEVFSVRTLMLLLVATITMSQCTLSYQQIAVGTKTSLEKQLMGEVEPLTEEEILVSSVRALATTQTVEGSALQQKALAARRRQLFNRDDIDELKSFGCLGEGKHAQLVARPCGQVQAGDVLSLQDRMVQQENQDRAAIVDWAVSTDPTLGPSDRNKVQGLYHVLIKEKCRSGDWVQAENGSWRKMK